MQVNATRNVGRPWTPQEDDLLKQAVAIHGENDNWKTVALFVPGRTNKACRKRWRHSLCPTVKKSAWTQEEDNLLLQLYGKHSTKWSLIARQIPGRTDDACSKRYREALDPSLKKDEWTAEEDLSLTQLHERLGGKWGLIGQELNRSGLGCRNRWRLLSRKKSQTHPCVNEFSTHDHTDATVHRDIAASGVGSSMSSRVPHPWPSFDVDPTTLWSPCSPSTSTAPLPRIGGVDSPPAPTQGLLSRSQTPPPFQYTSSSLSAALAPPDRPALLHGGVPSVATTDGDGAGPSNQSPVGDNREPPGSVMPLSADPSLVPQDRHSERGDVDQDTHPMDAEFDDQCDYSREATVHPEDFRHTDDLGLSFPDPTDPMALCAPGLVHPQVTYCRPSTSDLSNPPLVPLPSNPSHSALSSDTRDLPTSDPSSPQLPSLSRDHIPPRSGPSQPSPGPSGSPTEGTPSNPTSSYYRDRTTQNPRPHPRRRKRADETPLRLDSELPASSDPSIKAYACGHPDCWPSTSPSTLSCFATSFELSEHCKVSHTDMTGVSLIDTDRPFRCGLAGCGKGWKSLNGLQYHLQISKAHFIAALRSTQPSSSSDTSCAPGLETSEMPHVVNTTAINIPAPENKRKKSHSCPHPSCPNVYKQLSGLRYHLQHAHHHHLPVQLSDVPPTLARKMKQK
ncbi:hypothetical protein JAAARDRAFT_37988 [Jaapia argillacea MUCL 33604]|uniref:Uncharacterized protein n=1 Tax=Jaapia argillacea MUCL 33604 TaxID=933084 RepID=A0A067PM06_9AGAM|nr:hypothetical protein JAAARDRAFT_37988 [Jaapia argillacea MUCL 33604]